MVNDSEAVLWNKLEITCWPTLLILGRQCHVLLRLVTLNHLLNVGPDGKPIFVIIGEGHRDVLFRYVEGALRFYANRINPRTSPTLTKSVEVFQSHLLFPGKLCLLPLDGEPHLAISDSGNNRIVVISLQGAIKVRTAFRRECLQ